VVRVAPEDRRTSFGGSLLIRDRITFANNFTEANALRLAANIRAYWAKRDKFPNVWLKRLNQEPGASGFQPGDWVIKSDMVNGKPRP
jgi:hypothetical protein